jgi:hypothetical protein
VRHQPVIDHRYDRDTNVFNTLNGVVAPFYLDSGRRLTSGSNFIFRNTGHGLVAMVINSNDGANSNPINIQTDTSTSRATIQYAPIGGGATNTGLAAGGRRLNADSFQSVGTSSYSADQIIVIAYYEWANARLRIYENGVLTGDRVFQTAGVTPNNGGVFSIGTSLVGHIQECVAWQGAAAAAHAADIAGITSNINSRFNTF